MNQKERWLARGVLYLLGKTCKVLGIRVRLKKMAVAIEGEIQRSSWSYFLSQYVRGKWSVGTQNSQNNFHLAKSETVYPLNTTTFSSITSPWQPRFYFLSLSLTTIDTSHNWNHTGFVFLWLISLSIVSSWLIHVITFVAHYQPYSQTPKILMLKVHIFFR